MYNPMHQWYCYILRIHYINTSKHHFVTILYHCRSNRFGASLFGSLPSRKTCLHEENNLNPVELHNCCFSLLNMPPLETFLIFLPSSPVQKRQDLWKMQFSFRKWKASWKRQTPFETNICSSDLPARKAIAALHWFAIKHPSILAVPWELSTCKSWNQISWRHDGAFIWIC